MQKYLERYKHLIKEGAWVITNQVFTAIIGLFGLRIITELLDAKYLGIATLWLGITFLVRNIFISPISLAQARFHPEYLYQNNIRFFNNVIKNIYSKKLIITLILFVLISITYTSYIKQTDYSSIILILIFYLLIDTVKNYKLNQIIAERKQSYAAKWNIVEIVITYLLLLILLSISANTVNYLAGQTIAIIIATIVFGYIFFPLSDKNNYKCSLDNCESIIKDIKKYSTPFIPIAILSWITNLGDRYLIGSYLSTSEVGIYAAAYSISSRAFIIPSGIISGFLKPILFQAESIKDTNKAKLIFKLWIILVMTICSILLCVFYIWGDLIASVFLARVYRNTAPQLFLWIGFGYSFQSISQSLENRLYSHFQSSKILIPTIIGAGSNIMLNFLLLPRIGIIGAAISTAASMLLQEIAIYISLLYFKSKLKFGKIEK